MTESPQTPIVRFRKRMKIYDFTSNELKFDIQNLDPKCSNMQVCDSPNSKTPQQKEPLGEISLNQPDHVARSENPTDQANIYLGLVPPYPNSDMILSSPELSNRKCQSNQIRPGRRIAHWNSMDTAQSPWPYLEVDQLAQLLISSAKISEPPKFQSRMAAAASNYPTELEDPNSNDPNYTSSSNSSISQSSDEDSINEPRTIDSNNHATVRKRLKISGHHKFKRLKGCRNMDQSKKFIIIDCRYPYEFHGGHIRGALNLAEWPKLRRFLFSSLENPKSPIHQLARSPRCATSPPTRPRTITNFSKPSRTIFILHCEFSSHRAPQLFNLIRNHDRLLHFENYPLLRYPKVCVLRGGYAAFYSNYPELCEPSGYLRMHSRPDLLGRWRRHCERVNRRYDLDDDEDY